MAINDRGVIFGSGGRTRGQRKIRAGANPQATQDANMAAQFGRSQQRRPVFGVRQQRIRR